MKYKNTIFIFLLFILCSCPDPNGYKYYSGTFPELPVNMGEINSVYDDYNSASPVMGETSPLCFSSKRPFGGNFSIVYKLLDVYVSRIDGKITVSENKSVNQGEYLWFNDINTALSKINNNSNQLGPYLIPQGEVVDNNASSFQRHPAFVFLYASDESGNLDIKFTENVSSGNYSEPQNVNFLNSDENDAYPVLTADSSSIYFCSDRAGNYDIYKADLNVKNNFFETLQSQTSAKISMDSVLSTSYDDKCPFIIGNLMVFTSNRPGGMGGYDLYYSIYSNGTWSSPVNFGDKINTPYDEYRPIVKSYDYQFTNDFMIFSSNRPGGKGGFDLYYVGIDKMSGL